MKLLKFLRLKKNSFENLLDQYVSGKELLEDAEKRIKQKIQEQAETAVDFISSKKEYKDLLKRTQYEVDMAENAYKEYAKKKAPEDHVKSLIQIYLLKKDTFERMKKRYKLLEEKQEKIEKNIQGMNMKRLEIEAKISFLKTEISFIETSSGECLNSPIVGLDDIIKEAEEIINKKRWNVEAKEEVAKMYNPVNETEFNTSRYNEEVDKIYNDIK